MEEEINIPSLDYNYFIYGSANGEYIFLFDLPTKNGIK